MTDLPQRIDFWLDPGCPFTWRTSRWLAAVAEEAGVQVQWRLMSLAVLNEDKDVPPRVREALATSWRPVRLLAAAQEHGGAAAVGRLYTELGRLVHDGGQPFDPLVAAAAVDAAGMPGDLVDALDDGRHDEAVRRSHAEGQSRVGIESGSPITAPDDGPGFFGPVLSAVPPLDQALRLLHALAALSAVPSFSELKRQR